MIRNPSYKLLSCLPTFPPISNTAKSALTRGINAQRPFSQAAYPKTIDPICSRRPRIERFLKQPHPLAYDSPIRPLSTRPQSKRRGPIFRFTYRLFAYAGGFVLITGGLVVAFFIYDAKEFTYCRGTG